MVGLAGGHRRARALAVLVGGLTVSSVIGLPAATLVAQHLGWRASFWMVSIFGLLSLIGVATLVPAQRTGAGFDVRGGLRVFRSGRLWATLAANALALAAFLGIFSYISPLLTDVAGFSPAAVPFLQFLYGFGCIAGIAVGGKFADRRPHASLYLSLVVSVVVLAGFALALHSQVATVILFLAFGFVAFGANPAMTSRAMTLAGDSPLGASANTSAFNIGIAIGPWLGGLAIDAGYGFVAPVWIGVALARGESDRRPVRRPGGTSPEPDFDHLRCPCPDERRKCSMKVGIALPATADAVGNSKNAVDLLIDRGTLVLPAVRHRASGSPSGSTS
ncbi:MFS transporter, partial [Fodinicola feengrottensis]|uniref:MFS transporter n=1 Tax=Fodinicola feengrottensis TaxID=435914 RepID=UPI0013D66A70